MAKEYIEREAALKAIHDEWDEVCNYDGSGHALANEMESVIDSVPAADVRPVVRGRWVLHDEVTSWDETWECSVCGEESDMLEGTPMDNSYNFCHACGADMRTSEEPESLTYIPPDERSGVEDG